MDADLCLAKVDGHEMRGQAPGESLLEISSRNEELACWMSDAECALALIFLHTSVVRCWRSR